MTIEEKAKAYDNAVIKIRHFIDGYSRREISKEFFADIFFELKESEDEEIRKWIIDDIRFNMYNEPLNNSEYRKKAKKAIAWLKKQGEQKPTKWNEEEECYIRQLESMVKERWALAERGQDEEVVKNMSNLAFFLKTLNPNKKPTDEDMKTLLRTEYEKGRADAIAEMQKEWSEEDEKEVAVLEAYIRSQDWNERRIERALGIIDTFVNKSKFLKHQQKQEWNEEDEDMIQALNTCIDAAIKSGMNYISFDSKSILIEKVKNWLKFIKQKLGG